MKNQHESVIFNTRYGRFELSATDKGIHSLSFPKSNKSSKSKSLIRNPHLKKGKKLLKDYFDGKTVSFKTLKLDLDGYTDFQRKVYQQLANVPRGKVVTYGNLAKKVGSPKAARAIGSTMNKNRIPVILPCHRIVGQDGSMCGFAAGINWKKRLLSLEKAI